VTELSAPAWLSATLLMSTPPVSWLLSTVLILLSIMGVLLHPAFVILAIFGHGSWDILKHRGAGIPFISWYTFGCAVVDFIYGGVLFVFWMT
jgi:hypothetical protein